MAKKSTQQEAKYQPWPKNKQWCNKCTMFLKPDKCKSVLGDISQNGWCEYYKEKKK